MPHDIMKTVKIGRVVRKDKKDQPSDHSGNQKILGSEHGDNVDIEHLGFWGSAINPTGSNQSQFPGAPDPGTPIYYFKNTGDNGGIIFGIANELLNGGQGSDASGGQSLMGRIEEQQKQDIGVRIPPKIQESTERGAKVRKVQEKDQMHSLSLLDGLPIHGALFDMSGFRLPDVKNVPTAKQHNDKMMTNSLFEQLPGQIMSLAGLFQGLMQNGSAGGRGGASAAQAGGLGGGDSYWQDIHSTITPAMSAALNSLETLIQGHETDNGVGYVTGGVVHYGIYLENAVELLKQVQSMDDLMSVMNRLQWDTTIMGHDALDNVVIQIENAWGTALQEVDHNGTITVSYANANSQMEFANSMSNTAYSSGATSAPVSSSGSSGSGGSGGGSGSGSGSGSQIAQQIQSMIGQLFGQSGGTIQDMWKRLATTQEQTATQMHQKVTQQSESQKQKQVFQSTVQGGDPTDVVDASVSTQ